MDFDTGVMDVDEPFEEPTTGSPAFENPTIDPENSVIVEDEIEIDVEDDDVPLIKPKSAYFRFCNDRRMEAANVALQREGRVNAAATSKVLGEWWENCDAETKQAYQRAFQEENQVYQMRLAEQKRRKVDADGLTKPVKPVSAYLHFAADERARMRAEASTAMVEEMLEELEQEQITEEIAGDRDDDLALKGSGKEDVTKTMKIIAERWRELPDAEKQVYLEKAQQAKLIYEQEMAEWRLAGGTEAYVDLVPFPEKQVTEIIRMDRCVDKVSKQVANTMAKATSMFLQLLSRTVRSKNISAENVIQAVQTTSELRFLDLHADLLKSCMGADAKKHIAGTRDIRQMFETIQKVPRPEPGPVAPAASKEPVEEAGVKRKLSAAAEPKKKATKEAPPGMQNISAFFTKKSD